MSSGRCTRCAAGACVERIANFAAAGNYATKTDDSQVDSTAGVLAQLAELIAGGRLTVPTAATYPLEQVREAHTELAEGHTLGKIVLRMR